MTEPISQPVTQVRIQRYAWGFAFPLILQAAITNGIFDALDGSALTAAELSAKTGSSERGVSALVEALAGMELLERDDSRYRLAPDAAIFLVSGKPAFIGGLSRHTTEQILPNWMHLGESVKSGKPVTSVNQEGTGGAVAIAEFLVDKERTGPMNGLIFTLNMLVHTDRGTTFSFEELKGWLEAIGFVNVRDGSACSFAAYSGGEASGLIPLPSFNAMPEAPILRASIIR
ncbi:MAG TPA: methyltransferase dimerization domain-containing protein [Alloacidobacterium sp.]|nr:methyltransferase dimerization domain-containing protein [Alloacidobacterium sp.]